MEQIIKKTRAVGTSSGVLLPKNWLNKSVTVTLNEPSVEDIARDLISILITKKINDEVKGIYLIGSYARNEQTKESDIDILIITKNLNSLLKINNYEIIFVSEGNFRKNLKHNLHYQMAINESKVILNKELIDNFKGINYNPNNLISEIRRITKINEETVKLINENNQKVPDGIIYSIVLRLKELMMIKSLINKKRYSNKNLIKITGENSYSAYLRIKKEKKEKKEIIPTKALELIEIIEKWLKGIKD